MADGSPRSESSDSEDASDPLATSSRSSRDKVSLGIYAKYKASAACTLYFPMSKREGCGCWKMRRAFAIYARTGFGMHRKLRLDSGPHNYSQLFSFAIFAGLVSNTSKRP